MTNWPMDDASLPEWDAALDAIERREQSALFARVSKWLTVAAALTAVVYAPLLLVTGDARLLPVMFICASFTLALYLIRTRVRSISLAVYLLCTALSAGMMGISASVAGLATLLPATTGLIFLLLVGLILGPRHVNRALVMAALAALAVAVIDLNADWPRYDLEQAPALRLAVWLIVAGAVTVLGLSVFHRLDQSLRAAHASARRLNLLYETSRLFGSTSTLDELLPTVANNLARIVDASGCFIVLVDPVSGQIVPTAADDDHHEAHRHLRIRPDEPSLTRAVMQIRKPIMVEDVRQSPYVSPRVMALFPSRSLLGLPLIHHDQALGAILIGETRYMRRFTEDEITRLQGLVQQVAAEVANAQAIERERRQARELAILNHIGAAVAASLDPAEVCRIVVDALGETTGYNLVSVYLLEGREFHVQAVLGYANVIPEIPVERGILGKAARTGEPILLTDVTTDPDFIAAMPNILSEVCAPIRFGNEILGVINVETFAPHVLRQSDLDLLVAIAAQIAATLRNAQLFEQTRQHGEDLWGLYKMADATAAALDYEQVMQLVGDGLMRSLGVEGCAFSRWERGDNAVTTIGEYRLEANQIVVFPGDLGHAYDLSQYPATLRSLQTQTVGQFRSHQPGAPAEEIELLRSLGFASVMFLPLITHTGVCGLIEVYARGNREFNPDEIARGMAIANLAAIALERARLFDSERRSHQVTETLLDVARAMGSVLDLDQLLDLILDQLKSLIAYDSAAIALIDPGGQTYSLRASRSLPEVLRAETLLLDIAKTPTAHRLVTTRRPYRIQDTRTDPNWRIFRGSERIFSWLGVPLLQNEQVIGFLMVDHSRPGFFTGEHERLAQAFADHAAIAIENVRLLDQAHHQAEHERLVRNISNKISASIDLNTVMQTAVAELGRALESSRCLISLGADPDYMPVAYEFHQPDVSPLEVGVLEHPSILRTSVNERRTVVSLEPQVVTGTTIFSALVSPIFIRGRLAGALSLHYCNRSRRWASDEVALIEDVCAQLGIAVDNARLYRDATHSLSDLNLLHSIAIAVASATSLPEAVNRIVESVYTAMGHSFIALLLVDPQTSELAVGAIRGYPQAAGNIRIKPGQSVTGWVAQSGQPVLVSDTRADSRFFDASSDHSILSELAVPLIAGSEVVGVLNLESNQLGAFDEADMQLLTTLGSNLAMIIRNLRLLDEVRDANAQLRELDRLKSQFLANMSHELRTPLNSIIGFSEILIDGLAGPINAEQRDFVTSIHTSGRHLLKLINDVLDLSKIQAGKLTLDCQPIDPYALVEETRSVVGSLIAQKNQELVLKLEHNLPAVSADALRLKQILLNLLSNAHKFSPKGSSITLVARREDSFIRFSVIDHGDGIKPEMHNLVFQEFAQVDGGPTRQQEGTGLGLPITRHLVEMHDGRIWIESDGMPGAGAAFHFTIPAITSADPCALIPDTAADREQRAALIVEGDR